MKPRIGFLENEFERALASREPHADSDAVVEHNQRGGQERERRFRTLLDALPAAIYTTDAAGRITYFNEAAAELWGQRPALGSALWNGAPKLFWADGTPLPHDQCPMALALKERRVVRGMEAIAQRPDGTRVPYLAYPTPLYDQNGEMVGAVNMLIDISERKRAEDEHMMLMREVHHRVRNTLAIAQAVVSSTAKTSDTIEDFKDALIGRISALARTHLLLSDGARNSVPFDVMVHSELDPFDDASGLRVVMNGPSVEISTRHAVPLGMALHELTTNSSKYGALSALGGRVDATWRILAAADRRFLEFEWIESGGPAVTEPAQRGFGVQLIETVLPRQINAETSLDFHPDGLRVRMKLPLPVEAAKS